MSNSNNSDDFNIDSSFLDNPPVLKALPKLKTYNMALEDLPDLLVEKADKIVTKEVRVVGVQFGSNARVFDFDAKDFRLSVHDKVVAVQPEKGLVLGQVVRMPILFDNTSLKINFDKVIRIANESDLKKNEEALKLSEKYLPIVRAKVKDLKLAMDILSVDFTLDLNKSIVYFASETRVDFRVLLKSLASEIKSRVELRQVGVRSAAGMKGGLGPCGKELCCSKQLKNFKSINIKMAKDQGLSLKPTRVSGMCGRLKCCLQFELDSYRESLRGLPEVGEKVGCKNGCGVVSSLDILKRQVEVRFDDGQRIKVDAQDILSKETLKPPKSKDRLVATNDQSALLKQIEKASVKNNGIGSE